MSKKKTNFKPYEPQNKTITNTVLPAVATVFRGKKGTELSLNHTITQSMYTKELEAYKKELAKKDGASEAPKLQQ